MTANVLTSSVESLYPNIKSDARDVIPDALLHTITTQGATIQGDEPTVRVPVITSDAAVNFVKEGAAITEDAPELGEVIIHTAKLAALFAESNESNSHADPKVLLANSITRKMMASADKALLTNDSTSNTWQPTGLLNIEDITTGSQWGAADKATDVFDAISDAIVSIEAANGTATNIVVSPATWGIIRKTQNTAKDYSLGAPGQTIEKSVWGVPVSVSPAMTDTDMLVLDNTAIISASGQLITAKSAEAAFNRDSIMWRSTWRIGWNVIHPDRIVKLTKKA